MLLPVLGLFIGFLIPSVASRFGKVLPADPGRILKTLWHRPHFPKNVSVDRNRRLAQKWRQLCLRSVLWGLILSTLFEMSALFLPADFVPYAPIFITIVCLGIAVDAQYFLLGFTDSSAISGKYGPESVSVIPTTIIYAALPGV